MKPGKFTHAIAVLLSSIASLFAHGGASTAEPAKTKFSKKSEKTADGRVLDLSSLAFTPRQLAANRPEPGQRFPWKKEIVTTVFWIGEKPTANNPVPNRVSSWDKDWTKNYGGVDDPNPANRNNYIPVKFTPRQNPFYCALPYNDKAREGHRLEAPRVVPWFNEAYQGPAVSTCKGRWIAIRDYLGLQPTDVTDWRFVGFSEVPRGPWSTHGENNTFVINDRAKGKALVERLSTIAR